MPRIAIIDGGTSYHHRALYGERYRDYFSDILYVRELSQARFDHYDAVIVPDRTHRGLLYAAKSEIADYLARGGTIVAFGETDAHAWLPGVRWEHRPTNFWWWKTPGASLGLRLATPSHSLLDYLTLEHATWHYHGVFAPPPGAHTIIAAPDGAVLYEDQATTAGRMIVTSLDPFYHYGSYFMPVTEKFLDGFLTWLHHHVNQRVDQRENACTTKL